MAVDPFDWVGSREQNNLINRCDPPKDAGDTNHLRAGDPAHVQKMRTAINTAFPTLGALDREPGQGNTPVIGDTKPFMKRQLALRIATAEQSKQELLRLKLSPSGHTTSVLTGKTVAHDAGLGPSGLFGENYRLIITPGSILDPATKIRARIGIDNTTTIEQAGTLPAEVLTRIGMGIALPGDIQFAYGGAANPSYRFTINVMGNPIIVDFDAQFRAQVMAPPAPDTSVYFAGNPTKNDYIARANAAAVMQEIIKYVVIKNIGDALQVIWLLHIIMSNDQAHKDNYAMMSCDVVVWLRCLVNNLSIFLTRGNNATFYSSMNAAAFEAEIRSGLINDVIANNTAVINTLRLLLTSNNATLNETAIPVAAPAGAAAAARRRGFGTLVDRLVFSLVRTNNAIRAYLEGDVARALPLVDFRGAIKKLTMVCPVIRKGTTFKLNNQFRETFLPNNNSNPPILILGAVDAAARLPFSKMNLYSAISRTIDNGTVRNMCIGLPAPDPDLLVQQVGGVYPADWAAGMPLAAPPPPNNPNPRPYNTENWEYIQELLDQGGNHGKPGFIAYLLVTYFPEILHIGYICALYTGERTVNMTKLISVNSIVEALTDSFTSLDATGTFTTVVSSPVLIAEFTELDIAAGRLAQLARPVIGYIFPPPADPAAAAISNQYLFICDALGQAPGIADADALRVYGIYDSIYNEMLTTSYTNRYMQGYNPHLQIYSNVQMHADAAAAAAAASADARVAVDNVIAMLAAADDDAAAAEAEARVIADLGIDNVIFNIEVARGERARTEAVRQRAGVLEQAIADAAAAGALAAGGVAAGGAPAGGYGGGGGAAGAGGGAMKPYPGLDFATMQKINEYRRSVYKIMKEYSTKLDRITQEKVIKIYKIFKNPTTYTTDQLVQAEIILNQITPQIVMYEKQRLRETQRQPRFGVQSRFGIQKSSVVPKIYTPVQGLAERIGTRIAVGGARRTRRNRRSKRRYTKTRKSNRTVAVCRRRTIRRSK